MTQPSRRKNYKLFGDITTHITRVDILKLDFSATGDTIPYGNALATFEKFRRKGCALLQIILNKK